MDRLLTPFDYEYLVRAIWVSALVGGVGGLLGILTGKNGPGGGPRRNQESGGEPDSEHGDEQGSNQQPGPSPPVVSDEEGNEDSGDVVEEEG